MMESSPTSDPGTLLIVDDMPANLSVLFEFLDRAGFEVLVAQDGRRALQKAEYAKPDLILLDVMMPGMDGFQACEILKSQDTTREIPVIFMTALTETVDKVRGFSLGAADYITKPIQHEELLARVRAHLAVHRLQRQLSARNEELDTFSRTVAHDLKNPLNVVINYVEEMLDDYPPGSLVDQHGAEILYKAAQGGRKMIGIINALLTLAGSSRGMEVAFSRLDMAALIRQVREERLSQLLAQTGGTLDVPDTWPEAHGFAPWVEEVWANYLSNALKYGGTPPRVTITAQTQDNGMVRFAVRDNGPGIDAAARAKLFTPFTRLDTERAEGHGLGLSIVRQVVTKLGGEVGVERAPGEGSEFFFTLPSSSSA